MERLEGNVNELCIHSYVWIPTWTTAFGRVAAEKARAAGFDRVVVPLSNQEAIDPAAIARIFADCGVKPVNTANQRPDADVSSTDKDVRRRGIERLRHALRLARDMGSEHVGGVLYGVLGKASQPASRENLVAAADSLAIVAAEAQELGIRLALELLRMIGSPNIGLHLDTFHMNIEEADPLGAIEQALPHLAYFELDQNHRGLPDRGAIDFTPMLTALFHANYAGIIGFEAFSSRVTGPDVAAVIGIWRDMFHDGDEVARAGAAIVRNAYSDFESGRATVVR